MLDGVDWLDLARGRGKGLAVVKAAENLWAPKNEVELTLR